MQPYADDHLNKIYDLLFCDDIDLYRSTASASINEYRWKDLLDPSVSIDALKHLLSDADLETRVKLLASNLLRDRGIIDKSRHLYGVVVEVHMEEGLDVVAVYEDGTARYINYSGSLVVWETETAESMVLTEHLFSVSREVVGKIGPWDGDRLPPPIAGNARLSFLVSDGIYFGEAPFDALAADPMGGAVLNSAAEFMKFLVENAMDQSP
jgi:hypothetical protein